VAQLAGDAQQHVRGAVLRVGLLKAPLPAPAVDPPAVALDELVPRLLVGGRGAHPFQQGAAGTRVGAVSRHECYSSPAENLTAIVPAAARAGKRQSWQESIWGEIIQDSSGRSRAGVDTVEARRRVPAREA